MGAFLVTRGSSRSSVSRCHRQPSRLRGSQLVGFHGRTRPCFAVVAGGVVGCAFLIGFGTDRGTVAAAHDWDGRMEIMQVRPSHPDSYEQLCHRTGIEAFFVHLRNPRRSDVREELADPRLERAIGVVYRPRTEIQSHYFHASLPHQFDEYVWFDETHAVHAVTPTEARALPPTHPFGASHG